MHHAKFGLIGDPLKGSRSPRLFGAAYGGKYPYELIEGADFEASWGRFMAEFDAINVTAPFKELAFRRVLDLSALTGNAWRGELSGPAARIGATNLLVKRSSGVVEAHNSDFCGVVLSIAEAYLPGLTAECYREYGDRAFIKVHQAAAQLIPRLFPEKPQALVIGCGGAGKAAAVAAAELGFATALMNRTPEKAQAFARALPDYAFLPVPFSDFRGSVRECDLVIYTLPVPVPALDELSAGDFEGDNPYSGAPSKVVIEANYKCPSFGPEIKAVMESAGAQYVPGTNWHLFQALAGYGIMTGETPDIAALFAR